MGCFHFYPHVWADAVEHWPQAPLLQLGRCICKMYYCPGDMYTSLRKVSQRQQQVYVGECSCRSFLFNVRRIAFPFPQRASEHVVTDPKCNRGDPAAPVDGSARRSVHGGWPKWSDVVGLFYFLPKLLFPRDQNLTGFIGKCMNIQ